ncbi:RNA polymerase sigma factor [Actinorhabdospora filicis]|uniref:RNA polymerase sigma factor n=1 Tax=Actinorhabdospora filicis TaxID=1785913 RepID=A0A9W6SFU3_9ACTN|nr:sigma-70 family RNA polymerase sigma factor [Actinorhabdospora filicis]GLZ76379.1 RNA polymerase sigma factor [Actinorhabdospora filicis]
MDTLAELFETHRPRLQAVARRILGAPAEAEDAVQDAWLRASRAGLDGVVNPGGWLTTIVARVALNMLESRKTRREDPIDDVVAEPVSPADPASAAVQDDEIGRALSVVLDELSPSERVAFVLHDLFAVPFGEIAAIIDRTPTTTRKLASRGRQRVQGAGIPDSDAGDRKDAVTAFLAAARGGDFATLLTILDPDVVLTSDAAAVLLGTPENLVGASAVGGVFNGRASAAIVSLVDGLPGAVWNVRGKPRAVLMFSVENGRITGIHAIGEVDSVDIEELPAS